MAIMDTKRRTPPESFSNDDARWQAVVRRDPAADGVFFYSVKTTGVYCRPVCPARQALRKNVRFHDTGREALAAGFRACKRCQPDKESLAERHAEVVARTCRLIEEAEETPGLEELAAATGLSAFHLHRLFKAHTGVTPKQYAATHRVGRVRRELAQADTVTEAIYEAGYHSNGRFYESSTDMLGMTPQAFRKGGRGKTLRFAVGECRFGAILVAASPEGICAILLGDDPDKLVRELQDRFPNAELAGGDQEFEQ
nr:Ada metal-binding domain-containing protein [Zavarzinella formosa]